MSSRRVTRSSKHKQVIDTINSDLFPSSGTAANFSHSARSKTISSEPHIVTPASLATTGQEEFSNASKPVLSESSDFGAASHPGNAGPSSETLGEPTPSLAESPVQASVSRQSSFSPVTALTSSELASIEPVSDSRPVKRKRDDVDGSPLKRFRQSDANSEHPIEQTPQQSLPAAQSPLGSPIEQSLPEELRQPSPSMEQIGGPSGALPLNGSPSRKRKAESSHSSPVKRRRSSVGEQSPASSEATIVLPLNKGKRRARSRSLGKERSPGSFFRDIQQNESFIDRRSSGSSSSGAPAVSAGWSAREQAEARGTSRGTTPGSDTSSDADVHAEKENILNQFANIPRQMSSLLEDTNNTLFGHRSAPDSAGRQPLQPSGILRTSMALNETISSPLLEIIMEQQKRIIALNETMAERIGRVEDMGIQMNARADGARRFWSGVADLFTKWLQDA